MVSTTHAEWCVGPRSRDRLPSSACVHDGASPPGPGFAFASWLPMLSPDFHISIFVCFDFLSAVLHCIHLRSVGHDAPDLPTAPAVVLAGHERAKLVSRVTATGHWGSVWGLLQRTPRRHWPRLSQCSKLNLTCSTISCSSASSASSTSTSSTSPTRSSSRRTLKGPVPKATAFAALISRQTPTAASAIRIGHCMQLRSNLLLGIGQGLRIRLDGCKPSSRTSSPAPPSRASWLLLGATRIGKGTRQFHLLCFADRSEQIRRG